MNSTTLRAARLPISVVVSALVVAALLLLPNNVSGFGVSVSVGGTGGDSDEFALGNVVPFTVTILVEDGEILAGIATATVDLVITGPDSFTRTITGIPLGGFLPEGATTAVDQTTSFGPAGAGADVTVATSTPDGDTTISGNVIHEQILTEFDQPFVGYGFGFKGLVKNASITIDGTLVLPALATAGVYTLEITVDNDPSEGSAVTQTVTLTILPSLIVALPSGWSTYSIPIAAENSKFFASAGLGTGAQDGLVDPDNVTIAYKYNPAAATPVFVQVVASTILSPTEAVLVKSSTSHNATLIVQDAQTNPPSRLLSAGWNLFGLAVPLDVTTQDAADALISVNKLGSGASDGYSIVVSPTINADPFFIFRDSSTGVLPAQNLTRSRGYWVFMENDDTLAGFSTTPVDP